MSKVDGGGPIDPPPPRLHVTIFSRRLLGLKFFRHRIPQSTRSNKKAMLKMFCMGSWYNEVIVAPVATVRFGSKFHKSLNVDVVFVIQTSMY